MQESVPRLSGNSEAAYIQARLRAYPKEYLLLFLPGETRVHVGTQLARYCNEAEKEGSGLIIS